MNLVPQTSPLSELSKQPEEVLRKMENGPVLLLSKSEPAGLLVQSEQWNRLVRRLELLEDLHEARRALSDDGLTVSGEEMQKRMVKQDISLVN